MLTWVLVILAFSVMIIIHELGHFLMALKVGIKVEIFSIGMGPKIFSIKRNGIEYRVSAVPLGGYVKMLGEDPSEPTTGDKGEFAAQPVGNRFKVIFSGPLLNYVLGFLLLSLVFALGYPTISTKIGGLLDNYPAKAAGLKPDDKILAINGKTVNDWDEITEVIHKMTEADVVLTVDRAGQKLEFSIKPKITETKDIFGEKVKIAQVGIKPSDNIEYVKHGPVESLVLGGEKIYSFTILTYKGLWGLVTGKIPFKENVSGPVGIVSMMATAAKIGIIPLVHLTALISALLAIFNILPIPPLDGGLILFLGIEKLRGKALTKKTQEMLMQAGWVFFIAIMLFATYGDIFRMFGK